jgi:hypothetical protein
MKRTYKKPALFDFSKAGRVVFTLFIAFIAYKILTPPSKETARAQAPDGSREARLHTVYYYANQPSYKIHYRETGKHAWLSLFHLPTYTNAPPDAEATLEWSDDSDRLFLKLGGTSVWHHTFE